MGYALFGEGNPNYSTLQLSIATCFTIIVGEFNYDDLKVTDPVMAPIFFVVYLVSVSKRCTSNLTRYFGRYCST